MNHIIIAGAGQAGMQLADSLRAEGFAGRISMYGDELGVPYQRPPLSKDFLAPGPTPQPLPIRTQSFFMDRSVAFEAGTYVAGIDRSCRTVELSDGSIREYSELVLATGSRNRTLQIDPPAGVHYLRTLEDATQLHRTLEGARRAVVVGAGFIGLEFAAVARARGLDVTVLDASSRAMARAVSEPMSTYIEAAHVAQGVKFFFGDGLGSFRKDAEGVTAVTGTSGAEYPADVVLVGIGAQPNTDLAVSAGLSVTNGIDVSQYLRTEDEHIWAIGDCTNFPSIHTRSMTRLESVQNATGQAQCLARNLTGTPVAYNELPWFWSTQGTTKLQIAGILHGHDSLVTRGDMASGKFSLFCFRQESLIAVESINSPSDHLSARRLLTRNLPLSALQVQDPGFDLKTYSKQLS